MKPDIPPEQQTRILAIALAIALAAALAVMFAISLYDHSYADDWHYGVDVHLALDSGGGAAGALAAAARRTASTFNTWQGTYSAIFIMCLQPGVVSEALYGWGAILIICALVVATGYAIGVVVRDVVGGGRACWLAITCVALLLQTQLLPSPVEGFWWYNSAIYYTFYHALALFMVGMAIRLVRGRTRRAALSAFGAVLRLASLCCLAALVAGGNFVTALLVEIALVAAVFFAILSGRRRGWLLTGPALVHTIGFAASMAAPGNAIRQSSQFAGDNMGVIGTLWRSGLAGAQYTVLWTNGLLIVALIVLAPVLVQLARRSTCSFRLPALPAALSLMLFMASFTPTFFSMGTVGPGRVQNIRYDQFILSVLLCAGWLAGWAQRRWERRRRASEPLPIRTGPAQMVARGRAQSDGRLGERPGTIVGPSGGLFGGAPAYLAYYGVVLAIAACAVASLALDSRHVDDLTSVSAAASLIDGRAQDYDRQVRERLERIGSSEAVELRVPFYHDAPRVLFMGDIRGNMDSYINFRLAEWFGKRSIIGYRDAVG